MGLFDSLIGLGAGIVESGLNTVGGAIEDVSEFDITLSSTRRNIGEGIKTVANDTGEVVDDAINLDL